MASEPPSKKLRAETIQPNANRVPATTSLDAQHEEALRQARRQNRGIQGSESGQAGGNGKGNGKGNGNGEVEQQRTTNSPARSRSQGQDLEQQQAPATSRASAPGRDVLVDLDLDTAAILRHELEASPKMPTVQTTAIGRHDPNMATATARSLPSPAPSDENTQSPTFSEGQLGARRGRPSGSTRVRTPADVVGMPRPVQSSSPLAVQSPTFPPPNHHQQLAYTGVAQPCTFYQQISQPRQQSQPQIQQYAQQPQPQQQLPWQFPPGPPQRQGSHSRPNSLSYPANLSGPIPQTLRTPPIVPSNHHGHPGQMQTPAPATRRPSHELLAEINQRENALSQAAKQNSVNHGRITLLRDAIAKGDWFYLILSQLFCLRSIAPDTLPQSLGSVGDKGFDLLASFLCSNDAVDPKLLVFFSRFPEPLMNIYSNAFGDARQLYETRLNSVKDFLTRLPSHWDGLAHRCQEMKAPPLVQDMVETLRLQSVVLQTTCFRAIARFWWGTSESKGICALEQLHTIDQETFYRQNWRRIPQEKHECYKHYNSIFQKWQRADAGQKVNFSAPLEALQYFKRMPYSTMQALQIQHQNQLRQVQTMQGQTQVRTASPTLQNQHQMQMQRQMQAQTQAQAQVQGMQVQQIQQMPMQRPPPGQQVRPAGWQPFFPRAEDAPRAQPTHPDPNRAGLHQAHLRSPILGPEEPEPGAMLLYRHVVGYGVPPTKIKRSAPLQDLTFTISGDTWRRIAKNEPPLMVGEPPRRTLTEESLTFRLRCSSCPAKGFSTESQWVIADNYWPDELTFTLNDHRLETRRKLHHGRYLPIDLTEYLQEGTNTLQITTLRQDRDVRKTNFALAVEAIGVMSHDTITQNVKHIPAEESRSAIVKSLSGEDCGDDEIAVTSSSLTIKLTEPYSGCNMVEIPARSTQCLHHDCFDLQVFLQMRIRPHPGWPTVIDCWRCPICLCDARPQMLVVDEFLLEVRKNLLSRDLLETRAIVMEADGKWKIKEEERKGVRSASLEREERRSLTAAVAPKKPAIEVIELDSD